MDDFFKPGNEQSSQAVAPQAKETIRASWRRGLHHAEVDECKEHVTGG